VNLIDREDPRYAHEAAITLNAPGHTVSGRTRNLSRGGLCATLAEQIAVGTVVEVDIQLVFADDLQSEVLRIPARIVWCTSLDDGHQVGAQFLPLTREKSDYLRMFLHYLDDSSGPVKTRAAVSIDDRFE
jgi:hypothetical protein